MFLRVSLLSDLNSLTWLWLSNNFISLDSIFSFQGSDMHLKMSMRSLAYFNSRTLGFYPGVDPGDEDDKNIKDEDILEYVMDEYDDPPFIDPQTFTSSTANMNVQPTVPGPRTESSKNIAPSDSPGSKEDDSEPGRVDFKSQLKKVKTEPSTNSDSFFTAPHNLGQEAGSDRGWPPDPVVPPLISRPGVKDTLSTLLDICGITGDDSIDNGAGYPDTALVGTLCEESIVGKEDKQVAEKEFQKVPRGEIQQVPNTEDSSGQTSIVTGFSDTHQFPQISKLGFPNTAEKASISRSAHTIKVLVNFNSLSTSIYNDHLLSQPGS